MNLLQIYRKLSVSKFTFIVLFVKFITKLSFRYDIRSPDAALVRHKIRKRLIGLYRHLTLI